MLGDDLMDITNDKKLCLTKQLMNDYETTALLLDAVMEVPHEEVSSGVIIIKAEASMAFIVLNLLKNQVGSSK